MGNMTITLSRDVKDSTATRSSRVSAFVFIVLLIASFALRIWNLGRQPFWEDEAESAINALTILEHGYPVNHYLNIPIFENILVQEWPGNPEYEFKDISYSNRGLAIYHGWLPLYSIAASFALAGISADAAPSGHTDLRVRHTIGENRRRTVVARIPSLIFSLLFILTAFAAGRILYGHEAAWIAGIVTMFHITAIDA